MSLLMLGSDTAIGMINNRNPQFRNSARRALDAGNRLSISVVVLYELLFGIAKSNRKAASTIALQRFLASGIDVIPFEDSDAESAADIRAGLAAKGTPIGHYDVLIAGHARTHGAIVVTTNTREFARVPGLALEDWSK